METSFINELNSLYCSHYGSHNACINLFEKIYNNLQNITDYKKLIESVIMFLSKDKYNSIYNTCCKPENIKLLTTLLNLVPLEDLSFDSLESLANCNKLLNEQLITIIKSRQNIDEELLINLFNTDNYHVYVELKMKSNIVYTKDILTYLCFSFGLYDIQQLTATKIYSENIKIFLNNYILKLVNEKIEITRDAVIGSILTNKPLNIINQLITAGPEIKIDYLEAACFSHHIEAIEFFIDNKIMPNSECILLVFSREFVNTKNINISDKLLQYLNININPDSNRQFKKYKTLYKKIINLILASGYKLTYDDLYLITQNHVIVDNIDKYDIQFDDKFVELCVDIGFYPKYDKMIKPNINSLRNECNKYGNITMIRELIQKETINPDEICLENACKYKGNNITIKYLINTHHVPITLKALQNVIHSNGNSISCYIIDEFILQEQKKLKNNSDNKSKIKPVKKVKNKCKKCSKVISSESENDSSNESENDSSNESENDSSNESENDSSNESENDSSNESENDSNNKSENDSGNKSKIKPVKKVPNKCKKSNKVISKELKSASDSKLDNTHLVALTEKELIKSIDNPVVISKSIETVPPLAVKSKKIIAKKKVDIDDKIMQIKKKEEEVKLKFTESKVDISELDNLAPNKKEPVIINYTDVETKFTDLDNINASQKMIKYFKLNKDAKLSILLLKKLLLNQLNTLKLIEKDKFDVILPTDLSTALDYDITKYGKVINIKTIDKFCAIVLENIKKN